MIRIGSIIAASKGRVGRCRNPPHHARGDGTGRKAFRNKRTSGDGCFANRLRPEMETGPVCDCRSPTSQGRRQGWAFYKNSVTAVCHREFRSRAVWPIQQPNTSRVVERARSAYHALRWALGILRLGESNNPKFVTDFDSGSRCVSKHSRTDLLRCLGSSKG